MNLEQLILIVNREIERCKKWKPYNISWVYVNLKIKN